MTLFISKAKTGEVIVVLWQAKFGTQIYSSTTFPPPLPPFEERRGDLSIDSFPPLSAVLLVVVIGSDDKRSVEWKKGLIFEEPHKKWLGCCDVQMNALPPPFWKKWNLFLTLFIREWTRALLVLSGFSHFGRQWFHYSPFPRKKCGNTFGRVVNEYRRLNLVVFWVTEEKTPPGSIIRY